MKHLLHVIAALLVAGPPVAAQSLADVARQEEARRKTVKSTGKVYTNDTLKVDNSRPAPPPPAAGTTKPGEPSTTVPSVNLPGGKVEPAVPDRATAEKEEASWRQRMSDARGALDRSRIFADALQSRLNALATDIVNRADPAQRSQLELERQRAVGELDRVKREMADQTKAIADIEDEARKAGIPPGWIR